MLRKRAVFLDRDGVINRKMPEGDYVKDWSEFLFLPGVFEALKILKSKDVLSIIITNQACIAKGIISEKRLQDIHDKMQGEIQLHNGKIDAIYFCPHDISDGCNCRKPKPGLIFKAVEEFLKKNIKINFNESFLIGDADSDIIAGQAAGLTTIRIGSSSEFPANPIKTLLEAVKEFL
jgi:D-glycero-D-manno-heptose 1,7-bisphosphate phosphatase